MSLLSEITEVIDFHDAARRYPSIRIHISDLMAGDLSRPFITTDANPMATLEYDEESQAGRVVYISQHYWDKVLDEEDADIRVGKDGVVYYCGIPTNAFKEEVEGV